MATKSKHPSGKGWTTEHGYHRLSIWDYKNKTERRVFAHVVIWENSHGPIPKGKEIHHKNGNKQDNHLENLELVDRLTHRRLHFGYELQNGIWWKRCNLCSKQFPINGKFWYFNKLGYPLYCCKACHKKAAIDLYYSKSVTNV